MHEVCKTMATQTKFADDGAKTVPAGRDESKMPVFTVKARGVPGYVGSAWLNEGKFGKYISVKMNVHLDAGATLYLSPTRKAGKLLG